MEEYSVATRKKFDTVLDLYQNERLSMAQVARKIGISPSTVRRYLIKGGVQRRSQREASYFYSETAHGKRPYRIKENLTLSEKRLVLAAAMLYWGEGSKEGMNYIAFSNSDPDMVAIFLRFLREICGIQEARLKFLLHYYEDQNEPGLRSFWAEKLKIEQDQFCKSHLHSRARGSYKRKSEFGTISLRYTDGRLFNRLMEWLEQFKKEMMPG